MISPKLIFFKKNRLYNNPKVNKMQYFELFKTLYFQNILAKGLGGSESNHDAILQNVLSITTRERVPLAFSEMNESTFRKFLDELKKRDYVGWMASKGVEWAPSPTKEDPDGVALFLPFELAEHVTVTVPEMIPVSFEEKGKDKKTAAPVVKVTFPDKTYVAITHLKSKSDMSHVRLAQLQAYGIVDESSSVDPLCVGLIGDLNEGSQLERQLGTEEVSFTLKDSKPGETLVIEVLASAKMLPEFKSHPPTNSKESKTLKDPRYAGDTREAGADGMARSITDVLAFKGVGIKVSANSYQLAWDEWMAYHNSDHANLKGELIWKQAGVGK